MNLHPNIQDAYRLLHEGTLAFAMAEQQGFRLDVEYTERKQYQLTKRIELLEVKFKTTKFYRYWMHSMKDVKPNIYSNSQLSHFLYRVQKIEPVTTTKSGQGSTDEDSLSQLEIPELDLLLQIRKLKKIRDTYLDGFRREAANGWIHPSFNLHLVTTYRSSSNRPNFQNIPNRDKEAMKICRKALYPRLGHQLMETDYGSLEVRIAACVVGETKIETIDGSQTIKNVIERVKKGEQVFVYGYDHKKQRISVSKVTAGGRTACKVGVWKTILDNGESILSTPDHKFLLRDNRYVEVKDLKEGDSLMPFYKKKKKSRWKTVYEEIYLNNGLSKKAHNLIVEDVYNVFIGGKDKVVHHLDGNGCNNSLSNLKIISLREHMKIHPVQGWKQSRKGYIENNGFKERKISESNKGKSAWNKNKRGLYVTSEEIKIKIGKQMKGRIFSEDTKEKLSQSKKQWWNKKKENRDKVKCSICGNCFYILTNTHLKEKHQLTQEEFRDTYNHKVVSVEFYGYEDVYNINVEGIHNYATSVGVIIKNCYHQDPMMLKYITDTTTDMHGDMAMQIFFLDQIDKSKPSHSLLRSGTKNGFVFPQFYGDYYKNCAHILARKWGKLPASKWKSGQGIEIEEGYHLSDHLIKHGIRSFTAFTDHIQKIEEDFWKRRFRIYNRWKEKQWVDYQKKGYVDMFTGFRCSGMMGKNDVINYPIQGSAFHCLLWSFIQTTNMLQNKGFNTRIIGQIHDSIILDVHPEESEMIQNEIQKITCVDLPNHWKWIIVPLNIDIKITPVDKSWADLTKII